MVNNLRSLLNVICVLIFSIFAANNPISDANEINKKRNIVFIYADDLGWNDVSFHGFKQIPTPNIDALALDGVVLNKYYIPPACTPSRAALMTAKYPLRFGMQKSVLEGSTPWGLPFNEKILPEYLKYLNYSTHGLGKWNLGHFQTEYLPMNRGFDTFFGYWLSKEDYFTHIAIERSTGYYGYDLHDNFDTAWGYDGVYGADLFTDKAAEIIHAHDKTQPLFLYFAQQAPHSGNSVDGLRLEAPEEYLAPLSYIEDEDRRTYAGMVSALDHSVGKIIEALEQAGLLDNTLVVMSSDNGAPIDNFEGTRGSNFPLKGGKCNLWEGGVRGAAFIWSADLRDNSRVSNDLMYITDWLPTLLSAAGASDVLDIVNETDGVDMWPCLMGAEPSPRNGVLLNVDGFGESEAYIWNNYKVIKGSYVDGKLDIWSGRDGCTINGTFCDEKQDSTKQYEKHFKTFLQKSKVANILFEKYGKDPESALSCQIPGCDSFPSAEKCGATVDASFPPLGSAKCDAQNDYCLFDLEKDACEYNNVADQFPEILNKLKAEIDKYRSLVKENATKESDPDGNPQLHDGVWNPWL